MNILTVKYVTMNFTTEILRGQCFIVIYLYGEVSMIIVACSRKDNKG